MIHFTDQSEQVLEGAPTKSINILFPGNLFLYKAQNPAEVVMYSDDQWIRNIYGTEISAWE